MRKTDGVPLFVEELTKTVLASGLLEEQEDRYALHGPLPPLAIPATCMMPSWRGWTASPPRKPWRNWGPRSGARLPMRWCRPSRPWTPRPSRGRLCSW